MDMSNVGGSWGDSQLPGGKSGEGATGAIFGAQVDKGPEMERTSQPATSQPGKSPESVPRPKDIVRVTLLIPEDEYNDWYSSRPASVKLIEFKILDNDERARFGL